MKIVITKLALDILSIDIIEWVKNLGFLATGIFTIYKLFFEKKKNELGLDSSTISLLKEIQEVKDGEVKKLIEDYKEVLSNKEELKKLLEEQNQILTKYRRRNIYLESVLKKKDINFEPFKEL